MACRQYHQLGWTTAVVVILSTWLASCSHRDSPTEEAERRNSGPSQPIAFHDIGTESGITFVHDDGHAGNRYIMETVTAGLALFDYDRDGWIDVYFLNGAPLRGAKVPRKGRPQNRLYRNLGNWKFVDVTAQSGLGDTGFGLGVAVADYDNDGAPDVYVNNFGPNVLYHNQGDGTFIRATDLAGVEAGDQFGAGAAFLDIENDGLVDLYVANYVDFSYDQHVTHSRQGYPEYAGPRDYHGVPDLLFHNLGNGRFEDVSQSSGIGEHQGTGMGLVAADYDNDGDSDLFVLNDVTSNFLFVNDGKGHFEERALIAGAAYNSYGDALGSMGIDCADVDNDGWLDFAMTSYQGELPVLYLNQANGCLSDVTTDAGFGAGSFAFVNWGIGLVDFDNDGDRDALIANGHLQDQVDQYDDSTAYEVRNILLLNDSHGKFTNVSDDAGDGLRVKRSSRGTAFDDLDNDGDIDGVVLNSRRPPTVLRNDLTTENHWLQLRLIGTLSNRSAVGARVRVTTGSETQMDEVHSGRGYQSDYGRRLHFGLKQTTRVDQIEIHWPSGQVQYLRDVPSDQLMTVIEPMSRGTKGTGDDRE